MGKYAAVIPAAGLSSRMGAFKPLLPLGPKAMIDHVIDTLTAGGVSQVIVVTGHNADLLEMHLKGRPVQTVFNAGYARNQMFDSVKLGLAFLADEYDGVYITPGDVPLWVYTGTAQRGNGYLPCRASWNSDRSQYHHQHKEYRRSGPGI